MKHAAQCFFQDLIFLNICVQNFIFSSRATTEPFCSPMRWTLWKGLKRIGTFLQVFTRLLMYFARIAGNCWVGNICELMRNPRSTKKGKSYLKSLRSSRIVGSTQKWLWIPLFLVDTSYLILHYVHLVQRIECHWLLKEWKSHCSCIWIELVQKCLALHVMVSFMNKLKRLSVI